MPNAVQVYGNVMPETSWYLNPYHVKQLEIYNIWKLPPADAPPSGAIPGAAH